MAGEVEVGSLVVRLRGDLTSLEAAIDKGNAKLGTVGPTADRASAQANSAFSRLGAKVIEVNQTLDLFQRGKAIFDQFVLGPLRAIDHLDKLSVRTGIAVEKMGALALGADLAGTDVDELALGIDRFARSLASAGDPTSEQAILLRALGVTSRQTFPALEQLAHGLKGVDDAATRTDIAYTLLGRGARLIAFLDDQSEGFAALERQADRLGQTFDGKTSKSAVRVNDNLTRLGAAVGGVLQRAVIDLLPDLERAADSSERWAEANREIVSSGLADYLGFVGGKLGTVVGLLDKLGDLSGGALGQILFPTGRSPITGVDPLFTAEQQKRIDARRKEIEDLAEQQKHLPLPFSAGAIDFNVAGSGVLEPVPTIGPGSATEQAATAQAAAQRAAANSPSEQSLRSQAISQRAADLLNAEAEALKAVAAGKDLILDRDKALGATEAKIAVDALAARNAELAYLDKQAAALQADISLQGQIAAGAGLGSDAAKSRAEAVVKSSQDQAALADLVTQRKAAQQKYELAINDSKQRQLALDVQLADIDSQRAANKASYLQQVLAEASAEGATYQERLVLARQIDAAETASLEKKRAGLQAEYERVAALNDSVDKTAKLADLDAQLAGVNDQLTLAGHNVRALQREFINVGDTLNGIVSQAITGLATGTGKFEDLGKNIGTALGTEFVRSALEQKHIFDFKFKANIFSLADDSGDAGEKSGTNFVQGLLSKLGTGNSAGGLSAAQSAAAGLTTQEANAAGGISTEGGGLATSALATGSAAGSGAVSTGGGTGAAAAGGGAGGAAAGGYLLLLLAVINGISAAEDAKRAALQAQSITSFNPVTNEEMRNIILRGGAKGALGTVGLGGLGRSFADIMTPTFDLGSVKGALGASAVSMINPSVIPLTFMRMLGMFNAPSIEDQYGKALDKFFMQANVPQATSFKNTVYDRSLAELRARSSGSPEVQRVLQGSNAPEQYRGAAIDIGGIISPGYGSYFGNSVINNARALGETAKETRQNLLDLAQAAGVTLESGIKKLNFQFFDGTLTQQKYNEQAKTLITLLGSSDLQAVNTTAILNVAFSGKGRLDPQEIQKYVDAVQQTVAAGTSSAVDVLLGGGSRREVMQALGVEAGKTFVDGLKSELEQSDVFGAFTSKGAAELHKAAILFAAGDIAGARAAAHAGIADTKAGERRYADFLALIGPEARSTVTSLGGSPSSPSNLINQTDFGLPHFDTGGVVPGLPGAPTLAVVHGGETVSTAGQMGEVVGQLRVIAGHLANGRTVTVHVSPTVSIDSREIQRGQADLTTYQRAGVAAPRQPLRRN